LRRRNSHSHSALNNSGIVHPTHSIAVYDEIRARFAVASILPGNECGTEALVPLTCKGFVRKFRDTNHPPRSESELDI
jgi:hypothetical protein